MTDADAVPPAPDRSAVPFVLHDTDPTQCHHISAGDTVRMVVLRGPDEVVDTTVIVEIWDVGGSQPPNSHPDSVETFYFLQGEGIATSGGVESPVRAGQLLVLPPRSIHHIRNTGPAKLYALVTMTPDGGFADLVRNGPAATLDDTDLAVINALRGVDEQAS
jgi:mannose-6-phosphate isomerase-like protein (cupin superfamily)